ncbi:MAG TPA: TRAP transporter small permease [Gammaproteobacteria bacterium]|nr:TRAP transporter small permease [Gammaproteobacteria bacterium]
MAKNTAKVDDTRALSKVDRVYSKLENALNLIGAIFIFVIMLAGVAEIASRGLFNFPIFGYIDTIEIAMSVTAFLGLAYCQRVGGHVRMDMFVKSLHGRPHWFVEALATIAAIFVVTVLVYSTFLHFLDAWEMGDSTIDAELPLWPSKLLVPVCLTLLWLRLWLQLFGFVRLIGAPDATPIAVPEVATIDDFLDHTEEVK